MATSLRAAVHDLLHEVQDALRRAGVDPRYARFFAQPQTSTYERQTDWHGFSLALVCAALLRRRRRGQRCAPSRAPSKRAGPMCRRRVQTSRGAAARRSAGYSPLPQRRRRRSTRLFVQVHLKYAPMMYNTNKRRRGRTGRLFHVKNRTVVPIITQNAATQGLSRSPGVGKRADEKAESCKHRSWRDPIHA